MITEIKIEVPEHLFEKLKKEIPDFKHRINLNEPVGNFFYNEWKILDQFKNTVWHEVLDLFPFPIGEARLMKLEPGTAYYSHADVDDRYHLNISGENSFLVDLDKNILHPTINNRQWCEMDAGIRHSAVNFGNKTRIQLVVRKLLQKNNLVNPVTVNISLETNRPDYRYVFDEVYSPRLNRLVKQGLLDEFSIKGQQIYFTIEKDLLDDLVKICPDGFKVTVCQ